MSKERLKSMLTHFFSYIRYERYEWDSLPERAIAPT